MPEGPWHTLVVVSTQPPIQSPIDTATRWASEVVSRQAVDDRVFRLGQDPRGPFDAFFHRGGLAFDQAGRAVVDADG